MAQREVPVPMWHRIGTSVVEAETAQEALIASALNWTVEKVPLFADVSGKKVRVPERFATVRSDTGAALGVVGKSYRPVQNVEALNFMDSIIQAKEATYESAGSLNGGRIVWMTAKLPTIAGIDPVDKYLLLTTSHDGTTPVMAAAIALRIWCANQIQAAIRKARNKFRIRHTTNVEFKIEEARKALAGSLSYFHEVDEIYNRLKQVKFSQDKLVELVEKVFAHELDPDERSNRQNTRLDNITSEIIRLADLGMGTELPGVRGTAWGAFNAITEYLDHYTTPKGKKANEDERLINSAWFGSIALKTQKAFDETVALAKLAA